MVNATSFTEAIPAVGGIVKNINIFNFGIEPIAIMLVIVFSLAVTRTREDFTGAIIFGYVLMFMIGIATKLWLLVAVIILCGLYVLDSATSAKPTNE